MCKFDAAVELRCAEKSTVLIEFPKGSKAEVFPEAAYSLAQSNGLGNSHHGGLSERFCTVVG